jgi:hypothetical protein
MARVKFYTLHDERLICKPHGEVGRWRSKMRAGLGSGFSPVSGKTLLYTGHQTGNSEGPLHLVSHLLAR